MSYASWHLKAHRLRKYLARSQVGVSFHLPVPIFQPLAVAPVKDELLNDLVGLEYMELAELCLSSFGGTPYLNIVLPCSNLYWQASAGL